jgi:hypothetical protein
MILDSLSFLLGIHLCMTLIASFYRIIDLWYRISDFLIQILIRITLVAVLNLIIFLMLEDSRQTAFIYGQLFFMVFHIAIYWIGRIMVYFLARS